MRLRRSTRVIIGLYCLVAFSSQVLRADQPNQQKPLQVFILAGQSNMQGVGRVAADPNRNGGQGSLEYLVKNPVSAARFKHTIDKDGNWLVRDDVWIWYLGRKGGLSVGYGAKQNHIGPEFQFDMWWENISRNKF